ncbi:hypothetical protein B0H16DRAFT_1516248 [Mycena metata]|uniref:Uncharacterized protein n=1 Tax=Mycena metata TaxID=1033252 RepID=A0AAD7JUA9_9AGAR|nr:hypothetical protein B0H16DRAFT_1516248 [Mycena metata]
MTSIPSSHPSLSRSPSGPSKQDDYVSTLDLTVVLELRVNSSSVRIYPAPPPTISSDMLAATAVTTDTTSQSTHSICLLSGPLGRFLPFFGREASKWLIDIAHDIYDPAHFRGSLLVWKETLQQWRPVANTDPLTASRYRYDLPDGIVVGLSKISRRMAKSKSVTTDASAMAERVKRRDGECWVTRTNDPLANSHICPTRLGDHVGRIIFHTFTSRAPPHDLSVCDEIFGLSLSKNLNAWFDKYQLGFRLVPESAVRSLSALVCFHPPLINLVEYLRMSYVPSGSRTRSVRVLLHHLRKHPETNSTARCPRAPRKPSPSRRLQQSSFRTFPLALSSVRFQEICA